MGETLGNSVLDELSVFAKTTMRKMLGAMALSCLLLLTKTRFMLISACLHRAEKQHSRDGDFSPDRHLQTPYLPHYQICRVREYRNTNYRYWEH